MDKIRKQLNNDEKKVLNYLLKQHKNKTCGCNLDGKDEEIYMCPIGLYEDGCTENDLIREIKDITEIHRDELDDLK